MDEERQCFHFKTLAYILTNDEVPTYPPKDRNQEDSDRRSFILFQINISYGNQPNEQLLMTYGFVINHNPRKSIAVAIGICGCASEIANKIEIMKKFNLNR